MAGFDLDKQHSYTIPGGGRGEAGYFDVSTFGVDMSNTVDVPTRLLTIYHSNAHPDITMAQYIPFVATDGDITSANVTFTVQCLNRDMTARIYYELKGW